jgi:signal transduction histidine kinase
LSDFTVLALYPLWAFAFAVGVTALRLGRSSGRGLAILCLCLAFWVSGLILLLSPPAPGIAERVIPFGMLLAGAFVHAGADLARIERRGFVWATYAGSAAVALLGAVAPELLYGPSARSPGPLFWPVAGLCSVGTILVILWLARAALAASGRDRRRRAALAVGCVLGALGGGGVIGLRVLAIADVDAAAPALLVAVLLASYAILSGEHGRSREVVTQGLAYAVLTAGFSAVGLTIFFKLLPRLTPGGGEDIRWLVIVIFFAALPLDPLRSLVVEQLGRLLFRQPIGVRDLAEQVEKSEVRADHAERLAEIGRLSSAVAHEIRNPLGVIAAQAKLLERSGASPTSVAAIRAQVDRAKRFLDDLLRYSKPRPLDIREVEALPLLELVATTVRQILGDDAPPIEVKREGQGSLAIEVDRGALQDVATVLAQNAAIAVHGQEGGRVTIRAYTEGDSLVVAVEDNGPGVPREIEDSLFQPFVTGRGRDARHPGTGLGLAIAARWVERHGGSIRHERRPEGGARFLARWPKSGGAALPLSPAEQKDVAAK